VLDSLVNKLSKNMRGAEMGLLHGSNGGVRGRCGEVVCESKQTGGALSFELQEKRRICKRLRLCIVNGAAQLPYHRCANRHKL